ncbi:MAG: hypothetical protein ACO29O_07330 [Chitinophagaceae bacterium]
MENITLHHHIVGFTKMQYTIEEDGLRIIRKGLGSASDQKIDFEDIGSKVTSATNSFLTWIYLAVLFIVLSIVLFFVYRDLAFWSLLISAFFLLLFLNSRKNTIILAQPDHTSYIEFAHSVGEKEILKEFIQKIIERRNMFLKEKYMKLDNLLPFNQQYSNLIWLYELQLISREELQKKIIELEGMGIPVEGIERPGDRIHITGFTKRKDEDLKR